jgi:hypothetical protein
MGERMREQSSMTTDYLEIEIHNIMVDEDQVVNKEYEIRIIEFHMLEERFQLPRVVAHTGLDCTTLHPQGGYFPRIQWIVYQKKS